MIQNPQSRINKDQLLINQSLQQQEYRIQQCCFEQYQNSWINKKLSNPNIKKININKIHINFCLNQSPFNKYISLPQLIVLSLDNNSITSIQWLNKVQIPKLKVLLLFSNSISNVSSFRKANFPQLKQLSLGINKIYDFQSLKGMSSFQLNQLRLYNSYNLYGWKSQYYQPFEHIMAFPFSKCHELELNFELSLNKKKIAQNKFVSLKNSSNILK